ncbi:MAG: OsmC family protein [Gammaproteobacteria bacterium]
MADATASIGDIHYVVALKSGRHVLTSDEPAVRGGTDAGPAPYDLLAASLASCTAITLRMYAERKQWPLGSVEVDVRFTRLPDKSSSIDRVLRLGGVLTDEQRARLADIAERTPVTLTLKTGLEIRTTVE